MVVWQFTMLVRLGLVLGEVAKPHLELLVGLILPYSCRWGATGSLTAFRPLL